MREKDCREGGKERKLKMKVGEEGREGGWERKREARKKEREGREKKGKR